MEIKKRLVINGAPEVNAVMLYDEGEEYPVFLESLHNTIIFPALIESGYVLSSMPYGFTKAGVDFESLPIEKITITPEQEELMYNSIGVKLPYDEIKVHISDVVAKGLPLPPTDYTIFTREDLLKFLDATDGIYLDNDFMPLNYFVAPEARFSIAEYTDSANHKYISLINRRREMSLTKFDKLVSTLQNMQLLAPTYTALDVLDAYFSWGLDGLDFTIMSRRRETRPFRLNTSRTVNAPMYDKTYGLVDIMHNQYLPEKEKGKMWKMRSDADALNATLSKLPEKDTVVVEYSCQAKQDITILEGTQFNISYSEEMLVMQLRSYPTLFVRSLVSSASFYPLNMALPCNRDALFERSTLEALAQMIQRRRMPKTNISSINALTVCGTNPAVALRYIITKLGADKPHNDVDGNVIDPILRPTIDDYLNGNPIDDDQKSYLDDIMTGIYNIDAIYEGKQLEMSANTAATLKELYAVAYCMNIPLSDIFDKIRNIKDTDKTITFSNGVINHTIDVAPLRYSANGYKIDVMNYDRRAAEECSFFIYVTRVAREVGADNCTRHVGIEFYLVNRAKYKEVDTILNSLQSQFEDRCRTYAPDNQKLLSAARVFALSRYFEICFKQQITWPESLGNNVDVVSQDLVNKCRKYLETKIESVTALCSYSVNTSSLSQIKFLLYCVNAYITPDCIVPRGTYTIPEAPFYSLWYDWSKNNPAVWSQLVQLGVIDPNFVCWSNRYIEQQYVHRDILELEREDSLVYYYNQAQEFVNNYPKDKEFFAVPHPVEYQFPGLYEGSIDAMPTLPVPREGVPVVRLGLSRVISTNDYKERLIPTTVVSEESTYIKPFSGFAAEVYFNVDDVYSKIPELTNNALTVYKKTGTLYVPDLETSMDFHRLPEIDFASHGISHIYDRLYLIRTADGNLWEACI